MNIADAHRKAKRLKLHMNVYECWRRWADLVHSTPTNFEQVMPRKPASLLHQVAPLSFGRRHLDIASGVVELGTFGVLDKSFDDINHQFMSSSGQHYKD